MNSLAKMLCANFIDCKFSDFTLFFREVLYLKQHPYIFTIFVENYEVSHHPQWIYPRQFMFFFLFFSCSVLHVFPSSRYPHANSSKNFHCDRVEVSYYSWCSAMLELSLVNRTWDNSQADGCLLWMGGKSLAVQCRSAIMYIVYIISCTVYMKIKQDKCIYIYCIYYLFLYCIWIYLIYVPTFAEVDNGTVNCSLAFNLAGRSIPEIERMDTRNHGFAKGISFFFAIFGVILGKSILS